MAKLSSIEEAQRVFEDTHEPDVVSYPTLVRGYLQEHRFAEATEIFSINVVTWNAMISGYSQKGRNEKACLGELGVFVDNSLVSFYVKCGSLEDSLRVFSRLPERNAVTWNALICAHTQMGEGK
ncbi:hypothetical protein RND71_038752 [Anisodus tanguticus]|uniref:Pentatricopeptide repeat-containing protein n=1 Tax=Anisodus tanguticus TaxID=243964 RepID=A0AAE1R0P2_9SOLA|nr:hypothetical protein RND71_038752 [Anisodus tanguticus]